MLGLFGVVVELRALLGPGLTLVLGEVEGGLGESYIRSREVGGGV